jgi:hypothetical protein
MVVISKNFAPFLSAHFLTQQTHLCAAARELDEACLCTPRAIAAALQAAKLKLLPTAACFLLHKIL